MSVHVKKTHEKTRTLPSLNHIINKEEDKVGVQSTNRIPKKKNKRTISPNELDYHARFTNGGFQLDSNLGYETDRSRLVLGNKSKNLSESSKILERKGSLIGRSSNNEKNELESRGDSVPRGSFSKKNFSVHLKNLSSTSLSSLIGFDHEKKPLNSQALYFQSLAENYNEDINKTFEKKFKRVNEDDDFGHIRAASDRLSANTARSIINEELKNARRRIMNGDEIFELFEGKSDKIHMMKHGFCYFRVRLKEKHTPIRVGIKKFTEHPMVKVKAFVSSRIPKPSRFNCDAEFDGKGFRYSGNSSKSRFFLEEFLYIAIYSDENLILFIYINFGDENLYRSNHRKSEIPGAILNQIKVPKLNQRGPLVHGVNNEFLKQEIRRILERRKEKLLELAHGENKVLTNMGTEKFKVETVEIERLQKKEKEMRQMFKVEMKAHELFEEKVQQKIESSQKHDNLKAFKNFLVLEANNKRKLYLKMKSWLRIIFFDKLMQLLSEKLIVMRQMKQTEKFEKNIRFRLFFGMAKTLKRKGMGPFQRALCDSKQVMLSLMMIRRKDLKRRSKALIKDFLIQTAKQFEFLDKSGKLINNVLRIQKQWLFLKKRKEIYKDIMRLHLTRNFAMHYFELKKERVFHKTDFTLEQNLYLAQKSSLNPNLFLKYIRRKRRTNIVFPANDMLLQTQIIENFMMENLKRWRSKMDEYREKLLLLKNDESSKKKINVLKRFLMAVQRDDNEDSDLKSSREQEEEFNILKPPILYVKPKDSDIKQLVEQYLQVKNIL